MAGNLVPRTDGGANLGTASKEWNKIYAKELGGTLATLVAPLASPKFTGVPTAPTAASGTSTTQLATTKFVVDEIADAAALDGASKRDTAYSLGDTVRMLGIPINMYLECTTAGTTDSTVPVITQPVAAGDTISDGTCEWTVRQCSSIYNGVYNKKETFTSSGSFTAPYTGYYRITLQGAGGGGAGGQTNTYGNRGGGGGGSGANLVFYESLTKGTAYSFVIGAGGNGGAANGSGTAGGDSTIDIGLNSYFAGGGKGGSNSGNASRGGDGGIGKINNDNVAYGISGDAGGTASSSGTATAVGGNGGNSFRGGGTSNASSTNRGTGGSGGGHNVTTSTTGTGAAGGDGYITFEYCDL